MKKSIAIFLLLFPFLGIAQNPGYHVQSYHEEGTKAPNTHYMGEAWLNALFQTDENLPYNVTKATFKANSTLDWHKHSAPQVLVIVDGEGYYQERGKEPIKIKVGDVIKCDQNVEHWHASSKENDVTYLAIYSGETTWTEVLSLQDYNNVSEVLDKK